MANQRLITCLLLLSLAILIKGHGRLIEPPSRASAWRYGFNTPKDFNDNEGFCGGFSHQYSVNDGRCGICGDAWELDVRPHEVGGVYATGTIVREYQVGETITVNVDITANHKGHFEFKICPNNNVNQEATQECLDQYPLELADGSGFDFWVDSLVGVHSVQLRLPEGLTCTQCVLQWRYVCGNNWGVCEDGTGAVGCGPQEEFRACADVAIKNINNNTRSNVVQRSKLHKNLRKTLNHKRNNLQNHESQSHKETKLTTESLSNKNSTSQLKCSAVGIWNKVPEMGAWCQKNCLHSPSFYPKSQCVCK